MQKTLEKVNELIDSGIISKYAIAGGVAQLEYIEPSTTYDLDLFVNINIEVNSFDPLREIKGWAVKNSIVMEQEYIIIESIPVQFLPVYNKLSEEALNNAVRKKIFNVDTFILKAEYLMAIMLDTNRSKDRQKLLIFFDQAQYSADEFMDIITKFNLLDKYQQFRKEFYGQ